MAECGADIAHPDRDRAHDRAAALSVRHGHRLPDHPPQAVGPAGLVRGLPVGYQAVAGQYLDHTAIAFAKLVEQEIIGFQPPPGYDG